MNDTTPGVALHRATGATNMPNTLSTYLGSKFQADAMARYTGDFYSVICDVNKIRRGHIQFIMAFPDSVNEREARSIFTEAWEHARQPHHEYPVWATVPIVRDASIAPPVAPAQSIHNVIEERASLAAIYADDGAFMSAARVYRELADTLEKHHRETLL